MSNTQKQIQIEDTLCSSVITQSISNNPKNKGLNRKQYLWTQQQHEKFITQIKKYNIAKNETIKWNEIADKINSRSFQQVRNHGQKYLQKIQRWSQKIGTRNQDKQLVKDVSPKRLTRGYIKAESKKRKKQQKARIAILENLKKGLVSSNNQNSSEDKFISYLIQEAQISLTSKFKSK